MFKTSDFRRNMKLEIEGKPYVIVDFTFTNPGKGSAFTKVKLKNLESGLQMERTYKSGVDTFKSPDLENKEMEYLYDDPEGFNFMDQTTFETIHLTEEQVSDNKNFLQEGMKLEILYYNQKPIAIELPNFVSLKVVETDPGLKGDTAAGGTKKAILESGLQVNVPLFIEVDEVLKIDTRTSEYVERYKG